MLTQINLQTHFGGGEVYTGFLCRALDSLGITTRILVHPDAKFWGQLMLPKNTSLIPVDQNNIEASISSHDTWLLGNGPLPIAVLDNNKYLCTAMAHMPIQERNPEMYKDHTMIFPVSNWVLKGLSDAHLPHWFEPLYGVADLAERSSDLYLTKTSKYAWDHRKVRDHILSKLEPIIEPFLKHPPFEKRAGITIGIVSRITPIKQFPLLFSFLSSILYRYPQINIDIFGSGGYASIRELNKSLTLIQDRVRFWGHQSDVATVYKKIDYLLTGLPEKEALGLNIIEAQQCGTPVIAPDAQPFTETIVNDMTGFLYTDPRIDNGVDFEKILNKVISLPNKLDPLKAHKHLERFTLESFTERLRPVIEWVDSKI